YSLLNQTPAGPNIHTRGWPFPPPPLKGGITVTMEDLQCLDSGQFLNDVIIDFYLNHYQADCHVWDPDTCSKMPLQRRHQRVKTWTRHVDIFKKDFLFVPVNQEAHWYLVVICFPGLDEPQFEPWTASPASNSSENMDKLTGMFLTLQASIVSLKVFDSYKYDTFIPSDCGHLCMYVYLQSEWEVRRGSVKDFSTEQMKNSHCRVPLQDNSSDCGLYLLQYVESFLKDPVVHFDLPLRLERWFPRQQVRRKRDEIRDLILNLYRYQNQENVVR
uniref:Si:dkey-100n23.3 n=1 Tax=Myripristis murdjan TaxID=586833 RepID=A0A667Z3P7_9TELE